MTSLALTDAMVKTSRTDRAISNRIFAALMVLYAAIAAVTVFLPQGPAVDMARTGQLPAPIGIVALVSAALVFVLYGSLGSIGLLLSRKLGLPELWDSTVTNRQRFVVPALIGIAIGIIIIIGDAVFSPINGIGHFPHPPFPTSVFAAIGAAVG
ncbi:MAG: hypothetical protein ACXWNQ_03815, partial [Anaerolineales bacterium]